MHVYEEKFKMFDDIRINMWKHVSHHWIIPFEIFISNINDQKMQQIRYVWQV